MWVKNRYPKWNPCKWKQGLKPAVPWTFNFDPYPYEQLLSVASPRNTTGWPLVIYSIAQLLTSLGVVKPQHRWNLGLASVSGVDVMLCPPFRTTNIGYPICRNSRSSCGSGTRLALHDIDEKSGKARVWAIAKCLFLLRGVLLCGSRLHRQKQLLPSRYCP